MNSAQSSLVEKKLLTWFDQSRLLNMAEQPGKVWINTIILTNTIAQKQLIAWNFNKDNLPESTATQQMNDIRRL